ncbi:hypothetical protein ILYODFUR_030150 [Ilyodon furcidens]|uniref:Uncharacterized protein n=1 Tax=Ilyodon furcidens TaxID=33524 RepID=A0ABV0T1G1_9TELE
MSRTALAGLQVDSSQVKPATSSAFFWPRDAAAAFVVPPLEEYIRELHACWTDARAFYLLMTDGRALVARGISVWVGPDACGGAWDCLLLVPPDEAVRPDARCPRP